MQLRQTSKWMVLAGALMILVIKLVIRPLHLFDDPVRFFLGIAPNLFGSFLIPFGACWFFSSSHFLPGRIFYLRSNYDLRIVCLLGFVLLVVNEYLQLIPIFGRTFDVYDIIFSAVGLSCSYFVFSNLRQRYEAAAVIAQA